MVSILNFNAVQTLVHTEFFLLLFILSGKNKNIYQKSKNLRDILFSIWRFLIAEFGHLFIPMMFTDIINYRIFYKCKCLISLGVEHSLCKRRSLVQITHEARFCSHCGLFASNLWVPLCLLQDIIHIAHFITATADSRKIVIYEILSCDVPRWMIGSFGMPSLCSSNKDESDTTLIISILYAARNIFILDFVFIFTMYMYTVWYSLLT